MESLRNPLVTIASAVIIILGMHYAATIVNIILLSFLISMSITPVMEFAIKKGISSGIAVGLTILVVVIGGALLSLIVGVSVSRMIEDLPVYKPRLSELADSAIALLGSAGINVKSLMAGNQIDTQRIIELAQEFLSALLGLVSMSFVVTLVVIFILIEAAGHAGKVHRGEEVAGGMSRFFQLGKDVRKYVAIISLNGLITGVCNTILLLVLGVDYAVLWGVLSLLFNYVPNLGFLFSVVPPAIFAALKFGWGTALIVVIGFFIINSVTENVIKPRFMKKGFQISFLLLVISLLVWTWALGPMGAILGVPLTMVLFRLYTEGREARVESIS